MQMFSAENTQFACSMLKLIVLHFLESRRGVARTCATLAARETWVCMGHLGADGEENLNRSHAGGGRWSGLAPKFLPFFQYPTGMQLRNLCILKKN